MTALHAAAVQGIDRDRNEQGPREDSIRRQIVQYLLESGANPSEVTLTEDLLPDNEVFWMLQDMKERRRRPRMATDFGLIPPLNRRI